VAPLPGPQVGGADGELWTRTQDSCTHVQDGERHQREVLVELVQTLAADDEWTGAEMWLAVCVPRLVIRSSR